MIFTRSGAHDRIRKIVKEPDKQCNEILDKVSEAGMGAENFVKDNVVPFDDRTMRVSMLASVDLSALITIVRQKFWLSFLSQQKYSSLAGWDETSSVTYRIPSEGMS